MKSNDNNNETLTTTTAAGAKCIVIGCKNQQNSINSSVKYFRVPQITTFSGSDNQNDNQNENDENNAESRKKSSGNDENSETLNARQIEAAAAATNLAKKWYIIALREDLLEMIVANRMPASEQNFFVCMDHFDEQNLVHHHRQHHQQRQYHSLTNDENNMRMSLTAGGDDDDDEITLKSDAVPSVFDADVFQKMMAHHTRLASNQSRDQQQQQQQPVVVIEESTGSDQMTTTMRNAQLNAIVNSNHKRLRIDPTLRAVLMQRVPKAVKRTSSSSSQLFSSSSSPIIITPTNPQRHINSKNVDDKSTDDYQAIKSIQTRCSESIQQQQQQQVAKKSNSSSAATITKTTTTTPTITAKPAVKQANHSFLKEILPPPIMQSTKKLANCNINSPTIVTDQIQSFISNSKINGLNSSNNSNNKCQSMIKTGINNEQSRATTTTMTTTTTTTTTGTTATMTTYVYKRIYQLPDIDLSLECEEEEIIYDESEESEEEEAEEIELVPNSKSIKEIQTLNKLNEESSTMKMNQQDPKIDTRKQKSKQQISTATTEKADENSESCCLEKESPKRLEKFYSRQVGTVKRQSTTTTTASSSSSSTTTTTMTTTTKVTRSASKSKLNDTNELSSSNSNEGGNYLLKVQIFNQKEKKRKFCVT